MSGKSQGLIDNVSRQRRMGISAFLIVTAALVRAFAVATVGPWGLPV